MVQMEKPRPNRGNRRTLWVGRVGGAGRPILITSSHAILVIDALVRVCGLRFVVYRHTVLPGPALPLNCHTLKLAPVFQGPWIAEGDGSPWVPLASPRPLKSGGQATLVSPKTVNKAPDDG